MASYNAGPRGWRPAPGTRISGLAGKHWVVGNYVKTIMTQHGAVMAIIQCDDGRQKFVNEIHPA
jgi:hypothetical protein